MQKIAVVRKYKLLFIYIFVHCIEKMKKKWDIQGFSHKQ